MAYTSYNELDGGIQNWTSADEATETFGHYVEDIILLTNQPAYGTDGYIVKHKANFWGFEGPVWVGYDKDGNRLDDVIALTCPPFHPPNGGGPEVYLEKDDKPDGFPNMDP